MNKSLPLIVHPSAFILHPLTYRRDYAQDLRRRLPSARNARPCVHADRAVVAGDAIVRERRRARGRAHARARD